MKNCLIMGSGRSGTSMLSGILHNAGYYMGEQLYPPNISNPKGFFENSEINGINEKILSYYQSDERFNPTRFQRWLITINTDINITCDDKDVLNRIQEATHKHLPFCYKDPRFSYTLPVWEPYLPEGTKFLCIFRTPQDTMQSILKECATADYLDDFYVNEEYAYSVWESIYQRILNFDHEIQKNVAYFHYDQIVTGESINTLSNFLEADLDNSFSDTTLNRTDVNLEYISKTCIDIYNELCKKANFEDRIIFKSLTSDEEIEILKNRLQNKEMLLQKKSSSLRRKDNRLQMSEQEKRNLEINKQRLVDEKKALEASLKTIYSSLSWKIGRTITKLVGIFLDLFLIKKLNKRKNFIYIRALRFFKNFFIESKLLI